MRIVTVSEVVEARGVRAATYDDIRDILSRKKTHRCNGLCLHGLAS
jgi:hypothetical protein